MTEKYFAFKSTIPVLFGYLAIGCAFGLIICEAGYPWYLTFAMSVIMYAGAAQYAAAGMFAAGAGYVEIAAATFLINSRHMVYGLSLIDSFKGAGVYKPYLIFGLTDETYGLLTVTKVPGGLDRRKIYFYITLLNQSYWIFGGLIGYFLGSVIPFDFTGVDFALNSLFVVLLLEQWKSCDRKFPFVIAALSSAVVLIAAGPKHMLLISFVMSILLLSAYRRRAERC